jgi:long-subunit acyl-CoA synthetase (AMP-forming)
VVSERYGLTETLQGGLQPLPGVQVLILDAACEPMPAGAEGEIGVIGPNVMKGYYKNEAATNEVRPEPTPSLVRGRPTRPVTHPR